MVIRPAKKEDIFSIRLLIERNFDEIMSKYHSEEILERFKAHNSLESLTAQLSWKRIFVAEDNGQIIATGSFANFGTKEAPRYSVSNLYVLPELHKKGIGKMIVAKLIQIAQEENASRIHVPSSRNAVPFYRKMGFEVDNVQPDVHDELTWMTKTLYAKNQT